MSSLNFIGGEKGGVGKSVAARVLAQYFIDKGLPFTGFDTDRSHTSFTRFYADYAAPVVVDSYEGLGRHCHGVRGRARAGQATQRHRGPGGADRRTAGALDPGFRPAGALASMGITVNFWHVADAGKDSVDLLDRLVNTYGAGPNYIVVKNHGRGSDFSQLTSHPAMKKALALGAGSSAWPPLHEASMRKIDRQNASFWAACNVRDGDDALGMLERQRVKTWLKGALRHPGRPAFVSSSC